MITVIGFVVLAGCGALARALLVIDSDRAGFATGTLLVNGSGSLALGLLHGISPPLMTVLGTGLLGAFTTFSSFARGRDRARRGGTAPAGGGLCACDVHHRGRWRMDRPRAVRVRPSMANRTLTVFLRSNPFPTTSRKRRPWRRPS